MYSNGIVNIFNGQNMNILFKKMYNSIVNSELKTSPRGQSISELLHCTTIIENPKERYLFVKNRDINPFFHVVESLQILLGKDANYKVCETYNKALKNFLDDDNNGEYFAFYGDRIRRAGYTPRTSLKYTDIEYDQLEDVIQKIQKDPDTRQAVISLWDPLLDGVNTKTVDRPCNDMIMFKLRKNKLDMTVCNRSNDFIWGLSQTNIHQFSYIFEYVAIRLGVEIGNQIHYSDSLHIYDNNPKKEILDKEIKSFNFYELKEIDDDISMKVVKPIKLYAQRDIDDFGSVEKWNKVFFKEIEEFLYNYQIGRKYKTSFIRTHAEIFDSFWYKYETIYPGDIEELYAKYGSYDFFWTALQMMYRRKTINPDIKKYIYENLIKNSNFEGFFN